VIKVVPRGERELLTASPALSLIATGALGFHAAAEDDKQRWLSGFRRILDGLAGPLQVVITVEPGPEDNEPDPGEGLPTEVSPVRLRALDMRFADRIRASGSAHRRLVTLVTQDERAGRLRAELQEAGIPLADQEVAPIQAIKGTETRDAVVDASGWHRTWYVARYPGSELEPGWLFRLLPPGLSLDLTWHAHPLPSAWVVDYLQKQLVNMRASRMLETQSGSQDPVLAGAMPHAEDLQRRLTASQEKAFHVSTYLTLNASGREDLERGALEIAAAARAALCHLRPCTFRMLDGYAATRPLNRDRLRHFRVLDTSSLVTFFPWLDADLEHPAGLILGWSRATGAPVQLDAFDQTRHANANIGVFGHSGAGKTYLLSTLAMGSFANGVQVFIIDPEHEYGAVTRALGGVEVNLALGSGHALNVLELRPAESREESWLGPAVADIVDLAAVICGGLDEPERATMEAAARAAYSDEAQPVLGDVARRLPEPSRARAILTRWVQGSLGAIFSAPTNVDLDAPIVSFGMRELREEMVAPVHFLLAEALWSRIKARGRRRLLVVDELGLLFEDATIRRFVVNLARRIRKYDGALVFATQNPGDLLSSEQGAVVATNPAIHFFGAQRPGEAVKLQRTFELSTAQRITLETARRGDFLLLAGSERLPVRVAAPAWQLEVMRMGRDPPGGSV
jgi:hypothetical protein